MKKTPLTYILLMIFSLILCIAGASIVARVLVNRAFVKKYNSRTYDVKLEEKLLFLNFPESYVPYYNLGNAYYKDLCYSEAVEYYNEALKMYPPASKECSIRINLALALCNTIDYTNLSSQEKIDTAIFVLYKARDVLLENGWAVDEGDNYRDADAQQLKEDIDKMIEKLKNPEKSGQDQQNNKDSSDDKNDSSDSEGGGSAKEKRQQDELQKNKEGALKERQQERQKAEEERGEQEKENGSGGDDDNDGLNSSNGGMEGNGDSQNIKRW